MYKNSSLFALFIFAALTVGYWAEHADAASASLKTRRTEKRFMDCTLSSQKIGDCEPASYGIRVGVESFPPILIIIVIALWWPFYCCCKYCCNCCGGRRQTLGYSIPSDGQPRYTKFDILRVKIMMIICAAVFGGGCAWGIFGAAGVVTGANDLLDGFVAIPRELLKQVDLIKAELEVPIYNSTTDTIEQINYLTDTDSGRTVYTEANKTSKDIEDKLASVVKQPKEYLAQYSFIPLIMFTVPLFPIVMGILFCVGNCRKWLPMCTLHLMLMFALLMWLLQIIIGLVAMLMSDTCAEVDALAGRKLNVLTPISTCDDDIFSNFRTTFRTLENEKASEACRSILARCYKDSDSAIDNVRNVRMFACPDTLNATCPTVTFAQLASIVTTGISIHPDLATITQLPTTTVPYTGVYTVPPEFADLGATCNKTEWKTSCTFERCAVDCIHKNGTLSIIGKTSKTILALFQGAAKIATTFDKFASRFSLCESILAIVLSPINPGCKTLSNGLIQTRQALGVFGLCFIAGAILMAWGAKRFIPLEYANKDLNDEGLPADVEMSADQKAMQDAAAAEGANANQTYDQWNNYQNANGGAATSPNKDASYVPYAGGGANPSPFAPVSGEPYSGAPVEGGIYTTAVMETSAKKVDLEYSATNGGEACATAAEQAVYPSDPDQSDAQHHGIPGAVDVYSGDEAPGVAAGNGDTTDNHEPVEASFDARAAAEAATAVDENGPDGTEEARNYNDDVIPPQEEVYEKVDPEAEAYVRDGTGAATPTADDETVQDNNPAEGQNVGDQSHQDAADGGATSAGLEGETECQAETRPVLYDHADNGDEANDVPQFDD